ncbi:MAG: HEAT repeat domain-containing protein [Aggregatilineales bacterium]
MVNFNFNPENFGLGVAAGWATAYGVYRARHMLSAARQSVTQQVSGAQDFATRGADSRYINDLIKACESGHLMGSRVKLSEILVEPRFIPQTEFALPPDDDIVHDVFHIVPVVPDYPYLHAPYNIPTLSIEDLGRGNGAIAILGLPGSGRTTALRAIALWSLGLVKFTPFHDRVQEQIDEQDAELNDKDRMNRRKEREQIEEMAKRALKNTIRQDEIEGEQRGSAFRWLTPIYLNMVNVNVDTGEYGRQVDPAEPLIRAVQHEVSGLTARTMPLNLYKRLEDGDALILIDGYDDLPENERKLKLAWLRAFISEYKQNFIVVTGPVQGFGGLVDTGLTPVFLSSWLDTSYFAAANLWVQSWAKISGERRANDIPSQVQDQVKQQFRGSSPFEYSARLFATYKGVEENSYEAQMRVMIEQFIPAKQSLGMLLPRLAQMATLQLDRGYITAERLQSVAEGHLLTMTSEIPTVSPDDELVDPFGDDKVSTNEMIDPFTDSPLAEDDEGIDELFGDEPASKSESQHKVVADEASNSGAKSNRQERSETNKAIREHENLLKDLTKSGMLVAHRNGRYQFAISPITAYLAGLTLAEMPAEQQIERVNQPAWQFAFSQATIHTPLTDVVNYVLDAPSDILNENLLSLSRWMIHASPKAEWKITLFRKLGNAFVSPTQFPLVRERCAAALVGLRDRNAQVIFTKALRHPNEQVRKLACLGLGAMRDEGSIDPLLNMIEDPVAEVQLVAGLALGALGTEKALEEMVYALTEGSDQLRQAIAEAFAALPDEGYPILYDAVQHEDMKLRRAAVFGLRRINTPWALVALYRVSLEDDQWYVRTAAEQAFHDMRLNEVSGGVQKYPAISNIPWLNEWIATLGADAIAEDQGVEDVLLMALENDDPIIQELVITNMGQLGLIDFADVLYNALRHRNRNVRESAYRALGRFQSRLGAPLPAPAS